jgi:hypothetical protein
MSDGGAGTVVKMTKNGKLFTVIYLALTPLTRRHRRTGGIEAHDEHINFFMSIHTRLTNRH